MSVDRIRSVVVAAAAVAQVLVGAFSGSQTGALSDDYSSPVTPAGYAFAIWGLIYLASLAFAVYQLLPSQIGRDVHRRTGWWLVAAFVASSIWIPIFGAQVFWLAQIVILVLFASLLVAALRMAAQPADGLAERALLRLPTTLYLGWATLATMAGFGLLLRSSGLPREGGSTTVVSLLLIAVATLIGVLVILRAIALAAFSFTAGWALVAVVVASYVPLIKVAAVVGLLIVLAVLVLRVGRSDQKARLLLG